MAQSRKEDHASTFRGSSSAARAILRRRRGSVKQAYPTPIDRLFSFLSTAIRIALEQFGALQQPAVGRTSERAFWRKSKALVCSHIDQDLQSVEPRTWPYLFLVYSLPSTNWRRSIETSAQNCRKWAGKMCNHFKPMCINQPLQRDHASQSGLAQLECRQLYCTGQPQRIVRISKPAS